LPFGTDKSVVPQVHDQPYWIALPNHENPKEICFVLEIRSTGAPTLEIFCPLSIFGP